MTETPLQVVQHPHAPRSLFPSFELLLYLTGCNISGKLVVPFDLMLYFLRRSIPSGLSVVHTAFTFMPKYSTSELYSMPGYQFSDRTCLYQQQRCTRSRGLPRRRRHTQAFAPRRDMVFKLRRIRPTILNFRIFLGKKGDDIRRSLRAGEKCIWKSKRLPTKEFEEHWQPDRVFQNLFTGYDSLILQLLRSGITAFCQIFEAIGIYFDDQWDVFDNLSLDIDNLPEDERVKIQTPDVKRWQTEWKRMTTNYALLDGDQNYDYDIILARRTKRRWAWNRVSSREDPQNTLARSFYSHF